MHFTCPISRVKCVLFLIYLLSFLCFANENNQQINHSSYQKFYSFDKSEQLPTQQIGKITHDSHGLMWITTWGEGTFIYDGIKVISIQEFATNPQSNRLWSKYIQTIIEDSQGNIWIATSKGLNFYNRSTNSLIRINLPALKSKSRYIRSLFEDNSGNIWISLMKEAAIYKISPNDLTSVQRIEIYNESFKEKKYSPASMRQDSLGFIWVYQSDRETIFKLDTLSNRVVSTLKIPSDGWSTTLVNNPTLGINTEGGRTMFPFLSDLYVYQGGVVKKYSLKEIIKSNGDLNIRDLQTDELGRVWIATDSGLIEFDSNNTFHLHKENYLSVNGLKNNYITDISEDKQGNIWISTFNGIQFINTRKDPFIHIRPVSKIPKTPNLIGAYAMYRDKHGFLWLGNTGLDIIGAPEPFRLSIKKSFDGISIRAIEEQNNNLWIATLGHGIFHISYTQDKITNIKNFDEIDGQLLDIALNVDGKLWVAAYVSGLGYLNTNNNTYHSITSLKNDENTHQLKELSVSAVNIDSHNHVWVGTQNGGLFKLDKNGIFKQHYLADQNIASLYEDNQQRMWVGVDGGELQIIKNDVLTSFNNLYPNSPNILANKSVWAIIEDENNSIWLTTSSALVKVATNGEVSLFDNTFGEQLQYFNANSIHRDQYDSLYFGGESGITLLTKESRSKLITNDTHQNIFPLLKVKYQDRSFLKANSFFVNTPNEAAIELSYYENLVEFTISAPVPAYSDQFEYYYKLEGFHKDWLKTSDKSNVVQLMNLPSNNYTFKAKLQHPSIPFNYQETQVVIKISNAWWETWWVKVLLILFIILFIKLSVFLRNNHLIRKAKHLQDLVDDKTKIIASLLKQKNEMFVNISHEFRTPLSLILIPLENMIANIKYQSANQELHMIRRNGRRLLRMIEQLLDLAKLQSNTPYKLKTSSLLRSITQTVSSFTAVAKEKNIILEIKEFEDVKLLLIEDSLDKILINLVSNAIKYTKNNGQITIAVTLEQEDVSITVLDNGLGISEENQKDIFKRFSQFTSASDENIPGSGIGLALVKELIKENSGSILVKSKLNEGTCFTITLPFKKSLQPNLINSVPKESEHHLLEVDSVSHKLQPIEDFTPNQNDARLSILIIEDNQDMRTLLTNYLKGNYLCLTASNGESGVLLAIEQIPDLIICDVMMPGIDGFEVVNKIRVNECSSHIPIIMLTAKNDFDSRMDGWKNNVDEYLGKPFQFEELQLRINNLISIRHILKKRFGNELSTQSPIANFKSENIYDKDKEFIRKFENIVSDSYIKAEFSRTHAASLMAISERQLNRKLAALVDHNFSEYLRKYRLRKAISLFNHGLQVAQIGDQVGFSSTSYFTTCFKAEYGKTVKQYESDSLTKTTELE